MNSPFTDIKAQEIPPEKQGKFFVTPKHIEKLISSKAMFIQGERGSGKTTILRHLEEKFNHSEDLKYMAVYFRFETAYMKSLNNPELSIDQNISEFSQAIVAIVARQFCGVLKEICKKNAELSQREHSICAKIGMLLDVEVNGNINSFLQISDYLDQIRVRTMKDLRNDKSVCYFDYAIFLDEFCKILREEELFSETCFFVLLDEYENLTFTQQRVINSLIKSSTYYLTYKVCLRPEGFLTKDTVAEKEHLMIRNDYEEIDYVKDVIGGEKEIREHLREICKNRLSYFYENQGVKTTEQDLDIDQYLDVIKDEKDIESWDRIGEYKDQLRDNLKKSFPEYEQKINGIQKVLNLKLIGMLKEKGYDAAQIFDAMEKETNTYKNWIHNYKQNIIYQVISECEQTKKYCGFDMFAKLSYGNARTVLEILHYAFGDYEEDGRIYPKVSVSRQTEAVNKVSNDWFEQIAYIPVNGEKVKNLINSLGNLFEEYIQDKRAKKFEVNSFSICTTKSISKKMLAELKSVLHDAVVWGALLPSKATKIKNKGDIVFDGRDYMLHPILTPFFKISVNKRQKCELDDSVVYSMFQHKTRKELKSIKKELDTGYKQQVLELYNQ